VKTIDLHELDDGPVPKRKWIIDKWLGVGENHMIPGEGSCCKSWMMLDLAMAVSKNLQWLHKFPIEQVCRVLYIDEESREEDLRRRIKQLAIGRNRLPSEWNDVLTFWPKNHIKINMLAGHPPRKSVVQFIKDVAPDIIIIDSLSRSNSLDENKVEDVEKVFTWLDMVREEHDCGLSIIQHDKKRQPGDKQLRNRDRTAGSRAWYDMPDTVWKMGWEGSGSNRHVLVELDKTRDTMSKEQSDAIKFQLGMQQIDNDGIRVVTK